MNAAWLATPDAAQNFKASYDGMNVTLTPKPGAVDFSGMPGSPFSHALTDDLHTIFNSGNQYFTSTTFSPSCSQLLPTPPGVITEYHCTAP